MAGLHFWHILTPMAAQVTVLSPDAPEPLLQLEPDRVYAIGGIVDRTVRKGVTLEFAAQQGMQVGAAGRQHRLPQRSM